MTRKSLAVYYFSAKREDGREGPESNTQYKQTTGAKGYLKTLRAGVEAARDRVRSEGVVKTAKRTADKVVRKALRKPPKNG
jgi:hypothetical protein